MTQPLPALPILMRSSVLRRPIPAKITVALLVRAAAAWGPKSPFCPPLDQNRTPPPAGARRPSSSVVRLLKVIAASSSHLFGWHWANLLRPRENTLPPHGPAAGIAGTRH